MSLSTTTSRVSYNGDGATVTFAVPFYFLANTDLLVYVGGVLKALTTDYSVSGAGNQAGGSITAIVAPGAGTGNVVIVRNPDQLQSSHLPSNDPFPSATVETALDKLTMLVQRLFNNIGRSITLSDSDTSGVSTTLPTPAANSLFGWDATGTKLINYVVQVGTSLVNLAASSGASLIGHQASGTGAVATTVATALNNQPWINIENFNPTPSIPFGNNQDIYAALTAALATGANVYIPHGNHSLSATVYFGNQHIMGAGQSNNGSNYTNTGTIITVAGAFAAFAYTPVATYLENASISNMWIDFGATVPASMGGGIGIQLHTTNNYWPSFFEIKNVRIRGATYGISDGQGSFMCKLSMVTAQSCIIGFIKSTGTTVIYENCHALSCYGAWSLNNVVAPILISCAFDSCLDDGTHGVSWPIFYAYGCRGLVIDGMDQENNQVITAGHGIMQIDNCLGFSMQGVMNVANLIGNLSSNSFWINISGGSVGTVNGCDSSTLQYNAVGGGTVAMVAAVTGTGTTVKFTGCNFPAIVQTTTPSLAYSIVNTGTGTVNYENCITTNILSAVLTPVTQNTSGQATIPSVASGRGTTAVVATVATTLFSLTTAGAYLVNVWVTGSGNNYMSSAMCMHDGTTLTITSIKAGAFTVLSVSGNNVQDTSSGTTTATWSWLKIS